MWARNGAYTLSYRDRDIVLSRRGWLTDKIICAAQMLLLQFLPNMPGLQPPTLQKVFAFQVHSGEFVQIIHVRNSHWCVVSTVGFSFSCVGPEREFPEKAKDSGAPLFVSHAERGR